MNKFNDLFRKKRKQPYAPDSKMSAAISEWTKLYENRIDLADNCKSLNLAAAISSELARLATIEFSSEISGSKRADYLNLQYQRIIDKTRIFVEYACAKGGVILKPYLENGKILVNIIQADAFEPLSFSSDGELNGAVFYDYIFENGVYYTRVEQHSMLNNSVIITNTAYKSKSCDVLGQKIPLNFVPAWKNIEAFCRIDNVDRPLFAYLKMPAANTIDSSSPLGVSAFARATELIYDAYSQYSNLIWEFESGKRALYIDECAIRRDDEGNPLLGDRRLYRMLSTGDDTLFNDWSPTIRDDNILSGLDRILRSIEFNCGLAYGTLSDNRNVDKTAEEIRASKQRSYSTVCDIQNSLKKALDDLVYAMSVYCDVYSLAPKGEYGISFDFDDSIICDRTVQFNERLTLLEKGILNPWELRCWYLDEDEELAKKRVGVKNEV